MSETINMIQNPMSGTNHKFVLHKPGRPVFNWQIQTFELPSISMTQAKATSSPKIDSWQIAGTALRYENLVVRFLMDENIQAWQEIYIWIKEIVDGYDVQPTELLQAENTASIHIMTNNHSNLGKVFTFRRLYPVKLGGIQFDTTSDDPNVLTCDVVFQYDTYDLEIGAGEII